MAFPPHDLFCCLSVGIFGPEGDVLGFPIGGRVSAYPQYLHLGTPPPHICPQEPLNSPIKRSFFLGGGGGGEGWVSLAIISGKGHPYGVGAGGSLYHPNVRTWGAVHPQSVCVCIGMGTPARPTRCANWGGGDATPQRRRKGFFLGGHSPPAAFSAHGGHSAPSGPTHGRSR